MQEKEDRRPENKPTAPLISVIVPIYNVEKYVRKCLNSLKNQTMKQIEVICIDDGSTDRSGLIADEFESSEFPIFRVIHTENRGLSAARNRGLDEACAEWIMFVDSDDWVDPMFCELPYETAVENQADLVCFRSYRDTKWGRVKKPKKIEAPTGFVDKITAHEFGGVAVWNKIYRRALFSDISFPEGHVFEDLATAHKFVYGAKRVFLLPDRIYHYIDRKGSISNTLKISHKRDAFISALDRYEFFIEHEYPFEHVELWVRKYAISFLTRTRHNHDSEYLRAKEIVNNIKGIPKEFSIKQKIALMAWKTDKRFFYLVCKMSGRINGLAQRKKSQKSDISVTYENGF